MVKTNSEKPFQIGNHDLERVCIYLFFDFGLELALDQHEDALRYLQAYLRTQSIAIEGCDWSSMSYEGIRISIRIVCALHD